MQREFGVSNEMEAFAKEVVTQLRDSGFIAYFAGGCVRDMLLAVSPKDYDVATDAEPEQVRKVFGRKRTIAVGQSFGVMTVLGPKPHQVEVATFRNDGVYTDGRRPDSVTFSSPEEDAKRRDFTINGMFFDPTDDQVIDYVGGQADLVSKVVSAIGDPHERINEDRLRMLRAVRFATTYNFAISQETMSAIQKLHGKIASVSQERITHELKRMLSSQSSRRVALNVASREPVTHADFAVAQRDCRQRHTLGAAASGRGAASAEQCSDSLCCLVPSGRGV